MSTCQPVEIVSIDALWNGKELDSDNRSLVHSFGHNVSGGTKLRRVMINGEYRWSPSGELGRARMEVICAITELIEYLWRDNHICRDGDKPCAPKHF